MGGMNCWGGGGHWNNWGSWNQDPLQRAADTADLNGNGRVSGWMETQLLARKLGQRADLDGDGDVSRDEINFLKYAASQGMTLAQARRDYNMNPNMNWGMPYTNNRLNDLNNDGYISPRERQFADFARNRGLSRQEATRMFRVAESMANSGSGINRREQQTLRMMFGNSNANALINIFRYVPPYNIA